MRRHIHRGRVIDVGVEDVVLPNGVAVTLDVLLHPGASLVLPVEEASVDGPRGAGVGEPIVTLIRQYRHCAKQFLWEAPAGTLEEGEAPEQCAHRELAEEAGLVAGRLDAMGKIFVAPGYSDEVIHLFLARGCTPAPTKPDQDEVIVEVKKVPYAACLEMLAAGEIVDAKTVAALLHAQRFLKRR